MATFTHLNPDPAPVTQQGVCTEYPAGYGGTPVHWVGPLSQLVAAASGVKIKIPQGFQPTRYVVKTEPLAAPVITDGKPVSGFPTELVSGDTVTLVFTGSGVFSGTSSLLSGGSIPMIDGVVSGAPVAANDSTFVTVSGTTSGISGDAMTEVLIYCDIVDPHPPKMF